MTATVPTRLVDVPAYLCRIRPGRAVGADEWAAFYRHSADTYAAIAQTDPVHRHTALALAALDEEHARKRSYPVNDRSGR